MEWAEALLKGTEARVPAGALAPVAVIEAEAEKARREERVIVAENDLDLARKTLRLTLNLNPNSLFMPREIEPTDNPSMEPVPIDRAATLESALTHRPEMLSAGLTIKNRTLQTRYAENRLLPRLDFKAGAGLTGIAGELHPSSDPMVTNPFSGKYSRSLDRLGSGNYYNYSVGVVLQIPLSNAQARSKYSQARIELEQAQARRRDLVSQITLEVEKSLADLESNFKRIQTTRRGRKLVEENLRGQERRFEVGLVTQKDVIDFQSRLLDAQGAALRALTPVRTQQVQRTVGFVGTLEANHQVTVAAEIDGQVAAIAAALGDRVNAGQTLARIQDAQFRYATEQAEGNLNLAARCGG